MIVGFFRPIACCCLAISTLVAAEDPRADLIAARDQLLAQLQERNQAWQASGATRWLFRFDYGLLHRGRIVGFRRDGRRDTHCAWATTRQDGEWLGSALVEPDLDLLHLLDHDLRLQEDDGQGLAGTLRLQLQRGNWLRNMESYTTNIQGVVKSNTIPVLDYAIGLERQRPAWQSWSFTCSDAADAVFLDGTIHDALQRDERGHDLAFTCLWRPGVGVLSGWGWIPSFNRAAHRVARADLELVDGRLRGFLEIEIRRDAWLPRRTPPIGFLTQRWQIDLPMTGGQIDGTITADGDLGPGEQRCQAAVWQATVGSYRSDGVDGPREGRAIIGSATLTTPLPPRAAADDPTALYRQIADLLACRGDRLGRRPPSLEQVCVLPEESGDQAEGWQRLVSAAMATIANGPVTSSDGPDDPIFGPFYGDAAELTALAGPATYAWPADPAADQRQRWLRVPRFIGYGPLQRDGQPDDWTARPRPVLPEVPGGDLPVPGVGPAQWTTTRQADRDQPPAAIVDALAAAEVKHPLWYAGATIRCPSAVQTWAAVRIVERGCLFLNGVRVWHSPPRLSPEATAIVPIRLRAGDNELLLRIGGRQGFGRYAHGMGGPGHCSLHLALSGQPRSGVGDPSPTVDPDPTPPDPVPLPAWHLDTDTNVAWRLPIRCQYDPLPIADGVVVSDASGVLYCLAAQDGSERWRLAEAEGGSWGPAISSPGGDLLVAHSAGSVRRLGPDGQERWRCADPALAGQPGRLLWGGDRLIWFRPGSQGARVVAIDPDSGTIGWQRDLTHPDGIGSAALVPAAPAQAQALVTDSGQLIALADGHSIGDHLAPGHRAPSPPLVQGHRMILRAGEVGVDLVASADGRLGSRLAWAVERYKHYGYPDWPQADPGICDDGLIYVLRDAPEHSTHGPFPASHLYQIDSGTGHMTGYRKRFLMNALHPSDLHCSGRMIAACDRGGDVFGGEDRGPQIGIAASADPPVILGVSQGSAAGRAPVADAAGGWYLSTGDSLLRLAWGKPPERAMAVRRAVQSILAWDLGQRPRRQPVRDFAALDPPVDADRLPVEPLVPYGAPIRWLVDERTAVDADAPLPPDLAGHPTTWTDLAAIDPTALQRGVLNGEVDGQNAYISRTGIDPLQLLDRQSHSQRHLAGILRVDRTRVYEVDISGAGVQAWLDGQPLQDRQLVRLAPGDHALVLRISIRTVKAFMRRLRASITFLPAQDPAVELAAWEDMVRQRAPWLHALRAQAPESDGANHIDFLLQSIDDPGD